MTDPDDIEGALAARCRQLEERLAEQAGLAERYRRLLEAAPLGVFETTPDGKVLYANAAALAIAGEQSLDTLSTRDLNRDPVESHYPRDRFLADLDREGTIRGLETAWTRRDGSLLQVRESAIAHRSPSGALESIVGTLEDITLRHLAEAELAALRSNLERRVAERTEELSAALAEQKEAEEALRKSEDRLRQAQKMEAIGQLAGGVAHDFNNLLGVIVGQADLLLLDPAAPPALREGLATILAAARRGANLTRQLLAFSRRQIVSVEALDLAAVLTDSRDLLGRLLREDIDLGVEGSDRPLWVRADRTQIEQLILNLAINASDAMPRGGRLTLRASERRVAADATGERFEAPGRYALLTVEDTGTGIAAHDLERIFEPFFTTKELGTGLGLATVYGIARQAGGNVWVESEPGHGSRFTVALPAIDPPASAPAARLATAIAAAAPRGGTILLVEDEEMLRILASRMLESAGYEVLVTPSAEEALDLATSRSFRLLMTDVVLPGADGPTLAASLRARNPDLAIVFVSGHAESVVAGRGAFAPGSIYLQKPYTRNTLLDAVSRALANMTLTA